MDYYLRREELADINQVRALLREAFPTIAESKLVDALRANGEVVLSLVAVNEDDEVLGQILFSPVSTTPPSEVRGVGLAPVAVRADVQSLGIGSRLIREGLRVCKELEYDYCVVLGGPKYYQRFGFEKASTFGLQNDYGVDDEFMVIRFSDRAPVGRVKYAPEFALFSV